MDFASRSSYRGQVTKLVKSATEYLQSDDSKIKEQTNNLDDIEEELTVMLDRVTAAHESLKKANAEVVPLIKSDDLGKEADAVAEYEDKAITTITRIKCRLSKLRLFQGQSTINDPNNDSTSRTAQTLLQSPIAPSNNAVKLKKLQPKRFSGDFKDWVPFWEQYRVLVHDNPSLSTIDKFNYLETVLTGKAVETLSGLTPTEANYITAITLLKEEYGNSEKIIDYTMQRLLSIQPVTSKTDFVGLRRLYTSVLSSTRSLSALGIPSFNYFVMLKGVLLRCIPNELRVDFHRYYEESNVNPQNPQQQHEDEAASVSSASENSSKTIGDIQVNCLLKFLKREVESLEKANEARLHLSRSTTTNTNSRPVKTALGLFTSEKEENNGCFFCNSTNHEAKDCCCSKTIAEKKKMLVTEGRCFRCCKKGHNSRMCRVKGIICKTCNGRHSTSMCDPSFSSKGIVKPVTTNNDSTVNLYTSERVQKGITYLQTACAYASSEISTFSLFVRIIMDGGSQLSFIKSTLARRLKLPIVGEHNLSVITFGSDKPKPSKLCNRVRLVLRSQFDDQAVVLDAIEVPAICFDGLSEPTDAEVMSTLKLTLADNRAHGQTLEEGISVLIGADAYWQFATGEHKRLTERLTAINTVLGWTLQGPSTIEQNTSSDSTCAISLNVCACEDIQRFWKLDVLGILPEDMKGVSSDVSLHIYRKGDRFEASLPWKALSTPLHNNRTGAFIRMQSLVRKLCAAGRIMDYDAAMNEMLSAGITEQVSENVVNENVVYYLPHRPVYREDKETTKLRIVFDASAHAPNHLSLNDVLEVGENFLPDLLLILLNFRVGKVGLIADIEKAFLQIMLKPSDRDSHRFLWFSEKVLNDKILPAVKTYRMTRLTFGVKSSPYILGAMIQELIKEALNESDEKKVHYRYTCDLLKNGFYMDDFVVSLDDENTATEVYRDATGIFKSASMKLHKWNSNNPRVRDGFSKEEHFSASPKVLGLRWVIATDELQVDLNSVLSLLNSNSMPGTKRSVLRIMAKIFDPFGILSPWTVRLKILFQNMWRKKLDLDEELSADLHCIWATCRNEINELNEIGIPRHLSTSEEGTTQLHVFADASQYAFGAVAYARTVNCNGEITVKFICSKNRVAPLKSDDQNELTIPKLELTAALIAARLLAYIRTKVRINVCDVFLWTDSQIVLHWIVGSNKRWKPYVENRVNEIKTLSDLSSWRHCPGAENPADLLTRGVSASYLARSSIWFNGPSWLMEEKAFWPLALNAGTTTLCAVSMHADDKIDNVTDVKQYAEPIMNARNFSTWNHLLRITACFFRSIDRFRKRKFDFISAEDIEKAESYWIHQVQNEYFLNEISSLEGKKGVPSNSKLLSLFPFLDDTNKFLRVGGRLQEVEANINIAHPIILPKSSYITKLIVKEVHSRIFHGGTSAVLSNLRSKYWIIRGRQLVKNVIKDCFVCKLLRGQAATQPFAPLPKDRILSSKAFEVTGVDFAGPLYVLDVSGQRKKFYILLFTCAAVRAVHLEYTNDLTTESCILAIRRFIARRGAPRIIYSDNATTFKKASSEFKQLCNVRESERFLGFLSDSRIRWKFIVERAPWWGGFWERLVGVVKSALRSAVRRATLNNDQLHTLLTEVECVVNSRPLTYVGDDPLDLAPLTPANFLTGTCGSSAELTSEKQTGNALRKQWKERLLFLAAFKKRWFKEYLFQLRSLHHAKNYEDSKLQVGDVVLLEDSSLPRPLWHLAVIQNVFPGRDGKIRACEIRLSSGSILRRPIQLLYPLEISNSS